MVARAGAGAGGARIGSGRILLGSSLTAAVGLGMTSLGLAGDPPLLVGGAGLVGAGFGACQNDSFVTTVEKLGPRGTGTATTVWNIAYDGGLGLGALALGALVGASGTQTGFRIMSLGLAAATFASVCARDQRRETVGHRG